MDNIKQRLDYNPTTGVFTWKVNRSGSARAGTIAGSLDKDGYLVIRYAGKKLKAHRLAWFMVYGVFPAKEIDHINRIRVDNRITNLREADRHLQTYNVAGREGKLVGVRYDQQNARWIGHLTINGVVYRRAFPLARYPDARERAISYRKYLEEQYLCQS